MPWRRGARRAAQQGRTSSAACPTLPPCAGGGSSVRRFCCRARPAPAAAASAAACSRERARVVSTMSARRCSLGASRARLVVFRGGQVHARHRHPGVHAAVDCASRRRRAPRVSNQQRCTCPGQHAHAPRAPRARAAAHTQCCQPRKRRTLLVVNVELKVCDVARERASAACRVALAALDDAHGVELAVAPAAAQARAHLQRRLAGTHLRQNARDGVHEHRVRRCAARTGRTRSTRPVSTGAAGAAGAASIGSGLPGATTRLPLPEPLPSTAAGTSGDWLPSSAAAAPSASRRARHGKSPGPDNPRAWHKHCVAARTARGTPHDARSRDACVASARLATRLWAPPPQPPPPP